MITQSELKRVLNYDPETGIWIWKINISRKVKAGFVAGTIEPSGYKNICIYGKTYRSSRLAWFYMEGYLPEHEIDQKDRNPRNEKWDNLGMLLQHATKETKEFNQIVQLEFLE